MTADEISESIIPTGKKKKKQPQSRSEKISKAECVFPPCKKIKEKMVIVKKGKKEIMTFSADSEERKVIKKTP